MDPWSHVIPQGWALSLPKFHSQQGQVIFPWAGHGALDLRESWPGSPGLSIPMWPRCRPQQCCGNRRRLGCGGGGIPAREASAQRLRGRLPRVIRSLIPTIAWSHSRSFFFFNTKMPLSPYLFCLCVFFKFLKIEV